MKRWTLILSVALLSPGCAGKHPIVQTPLARCADLVPTGWQDGVEAIPVPDMPPASGNAVADALAAAKAWAGAYVGMSGQLEKANGRTADTIGIVRRCEGMVNAARVDQR